MAKKKVKRRQGNWWQKMRPSRKRLLVFSVFFCLVGIGIGNAGGKSRANRKAAAEIKTTVNKKNAELKDLQKKYDDSVKTLEAHGLKTTEDGRKRIKAFKKGIPWNMVLVNARHPMDKSIQPDLVSVGNQYQVDQRISDDLKALLKAADKAGFKMEVVKGYRSYEDQKKDFGQAVQASINEGKGYWDAYEEALKSVSAPGESDLGLGLSAVLTETSGSDEEKDKAAKWIKKHCADYGFILRYPPNKESIKDRKGNPFYIRFVGKDYASKLMKEDMTLEDFYGEAY